MWIVVGGDLPGHFTQLLWHLAYHSKQEEQAGGADTVGVEHLSISRKVEV